MADTQTPLGSINLWTRSTDVRTLQECPAKYLLGRIYPRDNDAGYFILGTAEHGFAEDTLNGMSLDDALENWASVIALEIENTDLPLHWTKRRTADTVYDDLDRMSRKFYADVIEGGMYPYDEIELCATELTTKAKVPRGRAAIHTQIDSIFYFAKEGGRWAVVDWKSGATAKASPQQLWIYSYSARRTPGSPVYGVEASKVELWFHHIDFSRRQMVTNYPGDRYIEGLIRWTEDQKIKMVETGFAPVCPDWYCDYCQQQSQCPAFGGSLTKMMKAGTLLKLETKQEER